MAERAKTRAKKIAEQVMTPTAKGAGPTASRSATKKKPKDPAVAVGQQLPLIPEEPQGEEDKKDHEEDTNIEKSPSNSEDESTDDNQQAKRRRVKGQERDQVDKNIEKNKIALTTILNYDNYAIWWKDVEALFVALECETLLPAALLSKTDPKYVQPNISQRAAKKVYAIIRNAMSQDIKNSINAKSVPVGNPEALLRHVNAIMLPANSFTVASIMKRMVSIKLEDFSYLPNLLDEMEELKRQLCQLDSDIKENIFVNFVLEALPESYNHLKESILHSSNMAGKADYNSYQNVKQMLLAAIQQNKSLPGATIPGKTQQQLKPNAVVHAAQSLPLVPVTNREVCRRNQENKCRNGSRCRYLHLTPSTTTTQEHTGKECYNCGSSLHLAYQCPQKPNRNNYQNTRGGRGNWRGRSSRHRGNHRVNFTTYPQIDFEHANAYVIQIPGDNWICYNANMREKPHDAAWIMDTGANIPVAATKFMLDQAHTIVPSPIMEIVVGGNNKITSTQTASFKTTSGVEFTARVIPDFGPNILAVHTLDVVKNGGEVNIANQLMRVYDRNGTKVITAHFCSDNLYRWWPKLCEKTRSDNPPMRPDGRREEKIEIVPAGNRADLGERNTQQRYNTSRIAMPSSTLFVSEKHRHVYVQMRGDEFFRRRSTVREKRKSHACEREV